MDNKKLDKLKENYNNIEVPDKLEYIVNEAIAKKKKASTKWISSVASMAILLIVVNISPAFASTLENIPIIGNMVQVIKFSNYSVNRNGFDISIDVSKVEGLKNKELENSINKELESEAKNLYNEYVKEIEELEKDNIQGREMGKYWHEAKTDNDIVLSLVVYNHMSQGSSNTTRKFYNIDKKKETALTLSNMFAGKDYVNIISENIKSQMKEQMEKDQDKYYWLNSEYPEMDFKSIKKEQGFYINENNELVICFDKYEVAPGYMGLTDFVIPSDILKVDL